MTKMMRNRLLLLDRSLLIITPDRVQGLTEGR